MAIAEKESPLHLSGQGQSSFFGSNTFSLSRKRLMNTPRFLWKTLLRLFCTFQQRLFVQRVDLCPRLETFLWIVPTHFSLPKQVVLSSRVFDTIYQRFRQSYYSYFRQSYIRPIYNGCDHYCHAKEWRHYLFWSAFSKSAFYENSVLQFVQFMGYACKTQDLIPLEKFPNCPLVIMISQFGKKSKESVHKYRISLWWVSGWNK